MVSVVRICGQSLQCPHFSVVLCDFLDADLLFTTKFLMHLGRLYATIGFDGNIPDVLVSFCKIGKCFFRIDGTAAKTGCHSHTNIICGSFFASSFFLSWSSDVRSILDTSCTTLRRNLISYPRLTKNEQSRSQLVLRQTGT